MFDQSLESGWMFHLIFGAGFAILGAGITLMLVLFRNKVQPVDADVQQQSENEAVDHSTISASYRYIVFVVSAGAEQIDNSEQISLSDDEQHNESESESPPPAPAAQDASRCLSRCAYVCNCLCKL